MLTKDDFYFINPGIWKAEKSGHEFIYQVPDGIDKKRHAQNNPVLIIDNSVIHLKTGDDMLAYCNQFLEKQERLKDTNPEKIEMYVVTSVLSDYKPDSKKPGMLRQDFVAKNPKGIPRNFAKFSNEDNPTPVTIGYHFIA